MCRRIYLGYIRDKKRTLAWFAHWLAVLHPLTLASASACLGLRSPTLPLIAASAVQLTTRFWWNVATLRLTLDASRRLSGSLLPLLAWRWCVYTRQTSCWLSQKNRKLFQNTNSVIHCNRGCKLQLYYPEKKCLTVSKQNEQKQSSDSVEENDSRR